MESPNHITDHKKFKHLTYEDYMVIELRPKGSWKPNAIAQKELHCAANTVRNIIKRGMDTAVQWQGSPLQRPRLSGKPDLAGSDFL